MRLWFSYQSMMGSEAWADFYGRMDNLKTTIERQLVEGTRDDHGCDLTEALRLQHTLLLNLMGIPALIEKDRQYAEEAQTLHSQGITS